jgi:hypothetical protein
MAQFTAVTRKVKPCFDEELERLFENELKIPRDTSSPTAFREFFLAHSMLCPVARRHDQPVAALSEARGHR